ncbi:MAG: hypothetical protein HDQ88_03290 [Clostridia bacterium]|nr:hypothetical protein [Clostridia bacterium]
MVTVVLSGAHASRIPNKFGIAEGTITKIGTRYFYVTIPKNHELRFDKSTQKLAPQTPGTSDAGLWNSKAEYDEHRLHLDKIARLAHFFNSEPKAYELNTGTVDEIYRILEHEVGQPYKISLNLGRTIYLQPADKRTKQDFPDPEYEGRITHITDKTFTITMSNGATCMFKQNTFACTYPFPFYKFWFYPSRFAYDQFHYY